MFGASTFATKVSGTIWASKGGRRRIRGLWVSEF
jgi:hypothetical protein